MEIERIIIELSCKKAGITKEKITKEYANYVISIYRSINPQIFKGHELPKVLRLVSNTLGHRLKLYIDSKAKPKEIDLHEYQIAALGTDNSDNPVNIYSNLDTNAASDETKPNTSLPTSVTSFLGINDLQELKLLFNPDSLLQHFYLVLDSDYRDKSEEISNNIKKFKWNYTSVPNTELTGYCMSIGAISNIKYMRLYQPRIPYLAEMETTAKRVSMCIEEFSAQSYICENGRKFHFLLTPDIADTNLITSTELKIGEQDDNIFNFYKPITTFHSITLTFGNPTEILTFSEPFERFIITLEFGCYKINED